MASTIQIKSGTGSAVPTSLAQAELAINVDSGSLYYGTKDGAAVSNNFYLNHITASGNISASGTSLITAQDLTLDRQLTVPTIANVNSSTHVTASINISGSLNGTVSAGSGSYHILQGDTSQPTALYIDGHITASGNISASGTIVANKIKALGSEIVLENGHITSSGNISSSGIFRMGTPDARQEHYVYGRLNVIGSDVTIGDGNITASGNVEIEGNISASAVSTASFSHIITSGDTIEFKDGATKLGDLRFTARGLRVSKDDEDAETVASNITASGNISASGNIHGDTYTIDENKALAARHASGEITLGNDDDKLKTAGTNVFLTAPVTASGNISCSGNFIGNNIGSIYDNYIYLTPTDFNNLTDNASVTTAGEIEDNGGNIRDNAARGIYHAQKIIPIGYKATHVKVLGSSTSDNFLVYSSSFDVGTAAQVKGLTSIDSEATITNVTGGNGTYVSVSWVSRGNSEVYGGYIKLAFT